MSMSNRDKKLLAAIVPLVVVLAYWFLLLAPQREAASTAAATLETVQSELADAEAQASTVQAAKANFARDYAAIVALGKAIPASVDMPSLLVQLEQAARGTGIEFDGVSVGDRAASAPAGGAPAAPAPGQPAPTAPSGQAPASGPGEAAAAAQGAADTANAAGGAPTGSTGTPGAPAAPAGDALESVPLEFEFKGSFFELADFFHRLKRFVYVKGEKVRVRGRLLTIDSVEYKASAETFPALSATVMATVFLSPKAEGAAVGATPTGPAPAAAAAPAPTAAADSGSSSPTPTATATP